MRLLALGCVAVAGLGCGVQLTPLGSHDGGPDAGVDGGAPVVMFLIDKSGSMNFAADDQTAPCTPACNTSGQPACPAGCVTRMQALKLAVADAVPDASSHAWMGLAIFPSAVSGGSACDPTSSADVVQQLAPGPDVPANMHAAAIAVNMQVQNLVAGGGSPTGDSIKFLSAYPPLTTGPRSKFVVLITDGSPNCNAANAHNCNNAAVCKCTLTPATSCTPASFCTQGCLDQDHTAAEIAALRAGKGVRTIVIGFGAETVSGDAVDALNAMATAGGFPRACPGGTDGECGTNDTCDVPTHQCNRKYFQAISPQELSMALTQILGGL